MAIPLYDVSVTSFQQVLGGVAGFLEKGLAHCKANNIDLNALVETRLAPDMLPFRFQVIAVAHHSLGAIQGAQAGLFKPPSGPMDQDYAGLQKLDRRRARGSFQTDARIGRRARRQGRDLPARAEQTAVHGRRVPDVVFAAEPAFPRDDRVRHPAHERRAARQTRLHGRAADEDLIAHPRLREIRC